MAEKVIGCFSMAFLLADNALTLACCVAHFLRGNLHDGILDGIITLVLFYIAGVITNLFHFVRHEIQRMPQRTEGKKVMSVALIFVPNYYLFRWSVNRCWKSNSLTIKCWTASLRLFYCSMGSLVQAVFQSYLVVHLWWEEGIPDIHYNIMIVAAVYLSVYAIYGVCRYIWVQYFDETGSYLPAMQIFLITFTLMLNMCGRVVAMSVVMGTLGWYWLVIAISGPFFVNIVIYINIAFQKRLGKISIFENTCRCMNLIPLALLSSMTVSDKRYVTILTTMAWIVSYLPQIWMFHTIMTHWIVWLVPTGAQVLALIIMMLQWRTFEAAFSRFSRMAGGPVWSTIPRRERIDVLENNKTWVILQS